MDKRWLLGGAAFVLALSACEPSSAPAPLADLGGSQSSADPLVSPLEVTPPAPVPAAHGTALFALAGLVIKGRAPLTGYSRAAFGPAWQDVDHNRCDTRNDILRRDLTTRGMSGSCTVLTGVLHDPYTAKVIAFRRGAGTSTKVQIDHVVALGDAWQMGAQQLTASARLAFANDPLELLAVDGPTNQRKGDADAASWLPPNRAFRCAYVSRQIAVKARYRLAVTAAEKTAMARVLAACPRQPLPTSHALIVTLVQTIPRTNPTERPTATPKSPARLIVVHPGAFCSPPGATGVTSKGTPMVCKLDSKGLRFRWGHA